MWYMRGRGALQILLISATLGKVYPSLASQTAFFRFYLWKSGLVKRPGYGVLTTVIVTFYELLCIYGYWFYSYLQLAIEVNWILQV